MTCRPSVTTALARGALGTLVSVASFALLAGCNAIAGIESGLPLLGGDADGSTALGSADGALPSLDAAAPSTDAPSLPPSSDAGCAGDSACGPTIPSDMTLWFMADRGVTVGDAGIARWADQSTHRTDATQADAAAQPKLVDAAGVPAVEFDGAQFLNLPPGFAAFTGASFFAVVDAQVQAGCASLLYFSNGGPTGDNDDVDFARDESSQNYEVLGTFFYGTMGGFEPQKTLFVSTIQDAAGIVQHRMNGVLTGTGTVDVPKAVMRTECYVGQDGYFTMCTPFMGQIKEMLFYTRGLSDDERQQVEAYVEGKWKLDSP